MLQKFVDLWASKKDPGEVILAKQNTEPPPDGAAFADSAEAQPPRLVAEVQHVAKTCV
jgi:kinesin family protein 1